jgi:hypothetical protein
VMPDWLRSISKAGSCCWTLRADACTTEQARAPDGRGDVATWQRYGTNPVDLLSTWELAQIERLLARPC